MYQIPGVNVIAYSLGAHFLLSALVGLLVYWLTQTILLHIFGQSLHVSCIHRYSLSLALCFSIFAHVLEDYTLKMF